MKSMIFNYRSLLTILVLSLTLVSCQKDDTVEPNAPVLSIQQNHIEVAAEGGASFFEYSLEYPTEAAVQAVSEANWISNIKVEVIEKKAGETEKGKISFNVSANEIKEVKEGVIKVSYEGTDPVEVSVIQAAKVEDPAPVLTLSQEEIEVVAEGAELEMSFTLSHPREIEISATSDAMWVNVQEVTLDIRNEGEVEEGVGMIVFKVDANEEIDAREAHVTLKYEGAEDVSFTVKQEAAAPCPVPEFTLAANYDAQAQKVQLDIVCSTQNATTVYLAPLPTYDLEGMLEEGMDLMSIMTDMAIPWEMAIELDEEQVSQINAEGLTLSLGEEIGMQLDTDMSFIVLMYNKKEEAAVESTNIFFGVQLKIAMEASNNSETKKIDLKIYSETQNVAKAYLAPIPAGDLQAMFDEGLDLESIMDMAINYEMVLTLSEDQLSQINGSGLLYSVGEEIGMMYNENMSFLLAAYDAGENRVIARADAFFGESLTLTLDGGYNAETQKIDLTILCSGPDAVKSYLMPITTTDLEDMLASGETLKSIMTEIAIPFGMAVKMDDDQLSKINGEGLILSMGEDYGMQMNTPMSFVVSAYDTDGNIKIERMDIFFGDPIALTLTGSYNSTTQKIDLNIFCVGQGAVKSYLMPITTTDLEDMLASGETLKSIMTEIAIPFGMAVKMDDDQLSKINGEGLILSMGEDYGMQMDTQMSFVVSVYDSDNNINIVRTDIYYGTK